MEAVDEHGAYLARLTHATVDIVYILDMDGVQPELPVPERIRTTRQCTSSLQEKKLLKMQSAPCFREASTKGNYGGCAGGEPVAGRPEETGVDASVIFVPPPFRGRRHPRKRPMPACRWWCASPKAFQRWT